MGNYGIFSGCFTKYFLDFDRILIYGISIWHDCNEPFPICPNGSKWVVCLHVCSGSGSQVLWMHRTQNFGTWRRGNLAPVGRTRLNMGHVWILFIPWNRLVFCLLVLNGEKTVFLRVKSWFFGLVPSFQWWIPNFLCWATKLPDKTLNEMPTWGSQSTESPDSPKLLHFLLQSRISLQYLVSVHFLRHVSSWKA